MTLEQLQAESRMRNKERFALDEANFKFTQRLYKRRTPRKYKKRKIAAIIDKPQVPEKPLRQIDWEKVKKFAM